MPEAVSETKLLAARTQSRSRSPHRALALAKQPANVRVEPSLRAPFVSDLEEDMLPLRRLLGVSLTVVIILVGCAGTPGVSVSGGPLFGTGVFHPPPKPGASISQTRMCECRACEPSNCCDDPDDDAPPATCGQDDDFSACAISIRSCASRCAREVWRVNNSETCGAKRPFSCCGAG